MPPKFSLQPVLDYRHNRVETLEVELSNLIAEQQRGYSFLEALRDYQKNIFTDLSNQQNGDMDLQKINHLHSNLKIVEDRIKQQLILLESLDQQVNGKRAEVVDAKQGEETLATLKRKEIERYQAEQARQENRQQDDIYIAQAYQRNNQTK